MNHETRTSGNITPFPKKQLHIVRLQESGADIIDFQEAKDVKKVMADSSENSRLFVLFEKVRKLSVYTTFLSSEVDNDPLDTA